MVEWHNVGPYKVSFDVREDASRFIVIALRPEVSWRVVRTHLVAQGLIDGSGWHGEPYLLFDRAPQADLGTDVQSEILRLWSAMRDRLRSRS
jgi:hypothetical protein